MAVYIFAAPAVRVVSTVAFHVNIEFYAPKLTNFDEILGRFSIIFANFATQTRKAAFPCQADGVNTAAVS